MEIIQQNTNDDFEDFINERTLNINNNPYFSNDDNEDNSKEDMSQVELKMRNNLMIACYKRGFVDAILLFCK